jgi:hypothetical protein
VCHTRYVNARRSLVFRSGKIYLASVTTLLCVMRDTWMRGAAYSFVQERYILLLWQPYCMSCEIHECEAQPSLSFRKGISCFCDNPVVCHARYMNARRSLVFRSGKVYLTFVTTLLCVMRDTWIYFHFFRLFTHYSHGHVWHNACYLPARYIVVCSPIVLTTRRCTWARRLAFLHCISSSSLV